MQKLKVVQTRAFTINSGCIGLLIHLSIIFTPNTAWAEPTKFKLIELGTKEALKHFCISKGFDDYSSFGQEDGHFYVVCNTYKDSDIKESPQLANNLLHQINEHLKL